MSFDTEPFIRWHLYTTVYSTSAMILGVTVPDCSDNVREIRKKKMRVNEMVEKQMGCVLWRAQINGVCSGGGSGGTTQGVAAASRADSRRMDAVRRSRSQGTRKLHKCLSTASYSEEAPSTRLQTSLSAQHTLLVTRQYCSFGSTVT